MVVHSGCDIFEMFLDYDECEENFDCEELYWQNGACIPDDFQTIDSPSPYGLYDMAGNSWEIAKNNDDSYLIKGGAYNSIANDLKSWNHQSYTATTTSTAIGFRCLRVIDQSRSNKSSRKINRKHHSLDSQKKIDKSFKNK